MCVLFFPLIFRHLQLIHSTWTQTRSGLWFFSFYFIWLVVVQCVHCALCTDVSARATHFIVCVWNRTAWRYVHIYICTYADCHANKAYDERKWMPHIKHSTTTKQTRCKQENECVSLPTYVDTNARLYHTYNTQLESTMKLFNVYWLSMRNAQFHVMSCQFNRKVEILYFRARNTELGARCTKKEVHTFVVFALFQHHLTRTALSWSLN